MTQTKNQVVAEDQKPFEFVSGSLFIIILCIVILFFLHGDIFSSLAAIALGAFLGGVYSRHKFQQWSLFVEYKALEDAKHLTIVQWFLLLVYFILIKFGLELIDKYIGMGFGLTTGILEVMVGFSLGYFVWLLWLHNRVSKKMEKGI